MSVKLNGARNSWGSEMTSSETFLITDMSNEAAPVVMGEDKSRFMVWRSYYNVSGTRVLQKSPRTRAPTHKIKISPFTEFHGNHSLSLIAMATGISVPFFLLNWPISSLSGTSPLAASSFEGDGNQPNLNNPPMQTGDQHLTVFLQSWWSCVISTNAQLHTHRRR